MRSVMKGMGEEPELHAVSKERLPCDEKTAQESLADEVHCARKAAQ